MSMTKFPMISILTLRLITLHSCPLGSEVCASMKVVVAQYFHSEVDFYSVFNCNFLFLRTGTYLSASAASYLFT